MGRWISQSSEFISERVRWIRICMPIESQEREREREYEGTTESGRERGVKPASPAYTDKGRRPSCASIGCTKGFSNSKMI